MIDVDDDVVVSGAVAADLAVVCLLLLFIETSGGIPSHSCFNTSRAFRDQVPYTTGVDTCIFLVFLSTRYECTA